MEKLGHQRSSSQYQHEIGLPETIRLHQEAHGIDPCPLWDRDMGILVHLHKVGQYAEIRFFCLGAHWLVGELIDHRNGCIEVGLATDLRSEEHTSELQSP